ncbi:Rho Gtpase-Activating Protein 20 [Manis pentadactyla]|nr:Rho Gtpase-Activating Protein 20 [Manis pentadactyla]
MLFQSSHVSSAPGPVHGQHCGHLLRVKELFLGECEPADGHLPTGPSVTLLKTLNVTPHRSGGLVVR